VRAAALGLLAALGILAAAPAGALGHADHPGATRPTTRAPGLALDEVGTFVRPSFVTAAPGAPARLYVVEQKGRVRIVENGVTRPGVFLGITDLVKSTALGEAGLLSIAFAPDYRQSGLLYVFYVQNDGDIRIDELERSPADPLRAERTSRRKVIEIEHSGSNLHFGGQLHFGPDGLLYASVGDGDGQGDPLRAGQRLNTLLGKLLRIDPRRPAAGRGYSVPPRNPFVGRRGRDEIWSYGLRNPWRFSFDRASGSLWLADVGQDSWEEVNQPARARGRGANFGWRCFEATHRFAGCEAPGHVPPVLEYAHASGSCAVTGGYVVRDRELPALRGRYVYGDFCTGALHSARLRDGRLVEDRELGLVVPRLTSFGLDGNGHLYAASRNGPVYRLRARG
jgi:glucose/arabinose dehydrogenase